jgi:hypothetical protein
MTGALRGTYRTASSSLNPLMMFSDGFAQNLSQFSKKFTIETWQKQELAVFSLVYQAYRTGSL